MPLGGTAEAFIAAHLERRLGSLPLQTRLRILLEQPVVDNVRHVLRPGPHVAGWLERPTPSELRIRLLPVEAGRTARVLLEEELLDVVVSRDHPPVIRLTEVFD
jgi:hypothetical protein